MNINNEIIEAVPTNIITGFLGVGKTSSILHLLKTKPKSERWAILVNEFGEIGVDGSLFKGEHSEQSGVFIREVPGGCMCCTAGLPMHIALNQLLAKSRPDRLLIEPTGLGHPQEVISTLIEDHYKDVLKLQKVITLVDARKLKETRYTDHPTFNQQIEVSDIVVGNKNDLYEEQDRQALKDYVGVKAQPLTKVDFAEHGAIDRHLLDGESRIVSLLLSKAAHHHHHSSENAPLASELNIPSEGFIKAENSGEGFVSVGWRFAPSVVFHKEKLWHWLSALTVERMKAVFITNEGIFGFNLSDDALSQIELDDCLESRIEIIAPSVDQSWESGLLSCTSES